MDEKIYKSGDKVPAAGKYVCTICGLSVEYLAKHVENGVTFDICTLCKAGTENGPKKPHEEFWQFVA